MKLRLDARGQFLGSYAVKHKISLAGYPLSYYKDNKWLYLILAGVLFGEEKNKKEFIKDIKKDKRLLNYEINGDFGIVLTKQPLFTEPAYDRRLIYPCPMLINKEGYHIWTFASFERKLLEKVVEFAEKKLGAKLLKLEKEKITNITFTNILPELTINQKKALELAISKGYYDYPKKIKMEDLAKSIGISYSTYQAHLKKAEGKILPNLYKQL